MGNINTSVEVPADAELRMTMGHLWLTADSLQNEGNASFHVVMGHVFVETGSTEEFLKGLVGLVIMGNVFCPESLASAVQPKIKQQMGHFFTYPDDATLITGSLNLTGGFLAELEKPAGFVVTGSLRAIENVTEALLSYD